MSGSSMGFIRPKIKIGDEYESKLRGLPQEVINKINENATTSLELANFVPMSEQLRYK